MTDSDLIKRYTLRVIEDPFDTRLTDHLQDQIDKCQNRSTHDGTVAPELWEKCKWLHRSAKKFVSDSRHIMRYLR